MIKVALVLEDSISDQALAHAVLQSAGWEVHIASTVAEGLQFLETWLAPEREMKELYMIALIDLIMDMHGLHLLAIIRDDQINGRLQPIPLVVLTAGYSAENARLARLAGCDALFQKPLTADVVSILEELTPDLSLERLSDEDQWMRSWLIDEGRRLLKSKLNHDESPGEAWTTDEIEMLLKGLSGKGRRPATEQVQQVFARLGGSTRARIHLATLAPLLGTPYSGMLRQLIAGYSIEESGRLLGYGRSQSYQLFHRLIARLSLLLTENNRQISGPDR